MKEFELFELSEGNERVVDVLNFGRLIAGGAPVTKLFKIKVLDQIENLRLVAKKLDDLEISFINLTESENSENPSQLLTEGMEIPFMLKGKETLLFGDSISFAVKVVPKAGGKYNPEFELSYFVVPKR